MQNDCSWCTLHQKKCKLKKKKEREQGPVKHAGEKSKKMKQEKNNDQIKTPGRGGVGMGQEIKGENSVWKFHIPAACSSFISINVLCAQLQPSLSQSVLHACSHRDFWLGWELCPRVSRWKILSVYVYVCIYSGREPHMSICANVCNVLLFPN